MKFRISVGTGLLLAILVSTQPSHAQWPPNGVRVAGTQLEEWAPLIASDGDGGAILVWLRSEDIYAQRVLRNGTLAWASETPICTLPAFKGLWRLVEDGNGGAYVVWADRRHAEFGVLVDQIYLQHILGDGTISPGWPLDGLRVCPTSRGGQIRPSLAPDGSGGVYVSWDDYRRGIPYENIPQVDLYVQRILGTGGRAPGWPAEGLAVCTAANGRIYSQLLPDAAGGVFIEWEDGRVPNSFDIYASRILPEGAIAPAWPVDGLALCVAPRHQGATRIVADGVGGMIAAWLDERLAPDGEPADRYLDIYAQRVSADGVIHPDWPMNGAPVCIAPNTQQGLSIVSDGAGGVIIGWSDYRSYFESAADLYLQRLEADGLPAPGWPEGGIAAARSTAWELSYPGITSDGHGGAVVVFGVYPPDDIYAQHVLGSGGIGSGWAANGVGVCTAPEVQVFSSATSDGEGGMIVAWEDGRNAGFNFDIYAQHVTVDFPTPTRPTARIETEPGEVRLAWTFTAEPPSHAAVERRMEATEWETIGSATSDDREYNFTDLGAPAGRVGYRLRYSTAAGAVFTPESWVTVPSVHTLSLVGFAPNPSTGSDAAVSFTLPGNERGDLRVYDAAGREVFGREVGSLGPGRHRLRPATSLSPGIYWVQLRHGDQVLRAKGLVLR